MTQDNTDQQGDHESALNETPRPLSGDRPIEKVAEDRLGYAGFAEALARSIRRSVPRDGMVLAVHGTWGSGKTSAVNMTVDALAALEAEEGEQTLVIRFNPWWFSEQENLTRAFFTEISAALGDKVSEKVQDGLKRIARRVGKTKDIVTGLLGLVPTGELAKALGGSALDALAKYGEESEKTLDEEREALRAALIEENKRILVIIDDVDRLPADEARQIFRLVKSVADLPNVIYLLVFDREVARRSMGEAASTGGPEWLEKIVQASFDLPAAHPSDLLSLFLDELQEIVDATKVNFEPDRWPIVLHRGIAPWLRTARDVARLSNAIAVSHPAVAEEVDLADLVAMEALRLFEPNVYDVVRRHPGELCGLRDGHDDQKTNDVAEALIAASTSKKIEVMKSALSELFPRLQGVWRNHGYAPGFMDHWDKAKRVCSSRRFPAYVSFAIGEDVLSAAEFQSLLATLPDSATFGAIMEGYRKIKRRSGTTKAALALDEITAAANQIPGEDVAAAARTLLWTADDLLAPSDEAGFYALPNQWRISYATDEILLRMPLADRSKLLEEMIANSPSLRFVGFMLVSVASQHGQLEGHESAELDRRLVDEAGLKTLSDLGVARFARASRDGTLLAQPNLSQLLYTWQRLAGEDAVRDWANDLMESDAETLRLAIGLLGVMKIEGGGVVKTVPRLNREEVGVLLDLERLERRIQEIKMGGSIDTSATQTVIEQFEKAAAVGGLN